MPASIRFSLRPGCSAGGHTAYRLLDARIRALVSSLAHDSAAAIGLLMAGSMFALLGATAVAVDVGSLYLAKRSLQGLADSTAISVSEGDFANASSNARALLQQSGAGDVTLVGITPGTYQNDPNVAPSQRFTTVSDVSQATAMSITLSRSVPLFFGAVISGKNALTLQAKAVAARQDMAAFSIGTQQIAAPGLLGSVPNTLLSALAGTSLNLSTSDVGTLGATQIDLLAVGDSVASGEAMTNVSYGQVFNTTVPLARLLSEIANAAPDMTTADTFRTAAVAVSGGSVQLSRLIDLGPLAAGMAGAPHTPLPVDGYTLLRSVLQLAQGSTYSASMPISAPGLLSAQLKIVGGNGTQHSPLMTVSAARSVVLHSQLTRVWLDVQVASAIAGIASLDVPVYIEMAPGAARMTAISCTGNTLTDGVTLGVTPGIGNAAIGTISQSALYDLTRVPTITPAQLARTLLVSITGSAQLSVGGAQEQAVFFSKSAISAQVIKSVATQDAVTALAATLTRNTRITVTALGLGINVSSITTAVGSTLSLAAPAIDTVLSSVLSSLGVGLGVSNVSVDRMRCGQPTLVG